jgi:hypothetical protein
MTCGRAVHQPAPPPPSPGPALWCANQPALDQPEVYRCARAACADCNVDFSLRMQSRSGLCHLPRMQNRARTIDDLQLSRAVFAQPDQHSGCIRPEKRGHLSGDLHRVIALQPLQRLNKKHPVVNFTVRAVIAVDAFAFEKELSLQWRPTFPSRRTARASSKRSGGKDPCRIIF